ncbi:MAG TPA: hypothetical protein VKT73_13140 [Xanthobacteraceae bacterium]|nr:hypothetical protein [Xanthobacteraceae bacterium]
MRITDIKIDSNAIEHGDWVDAPFIPGLRLKVRGIGNSDYKALAVKQAALSGFQKTDEIEEANLSEQLIETILVDWDGLEDDDGKPIPYSKDKAREYILDPDLRAFRWSVNAAATAILSKKKATQEQVAKN